MHAKFPAPHAPQPPSDDGAEWSDVRLLGYAPMDETHEEFYIVTRGLLDCTAETMDAALAAFEAHAVAHFRQEEDWMRSGDFKAADCHFDEHTAVLTSTRELRQYVTEGRVRPAVVHDFAQHLLRWFPRHADYMDSALAAWMSKRDFGGRPVVLRRDLNLRSNRGVA